MKRPRLCGKRRARALNPACLIKIRLRQPLVALERDARRVEDQAAIDDPQGWVNPQAEPLDRGSQVPGIDGGAVDRRLTLHGIKQGAVQKRNVQRMAEQLLVQAGNGRGRRRLGQGESAAIQLAGQTQSTCRAAIFQPRDRIAAKRRSERRRRREAGGSRVCGLRSSPL